MTRSTLAELLECSVTAALFSVYVYVYVSTSLYSDAFNTCISEHPSSIDVHVVLAYWCCNFVVVVTVNQSLLY